MIRLAISLLYELGLALAAMVLLWQTAGWEVAFAALFLWMSLWRPTQ